MFKDQCCKYFLLLLLVIFCLNLKGQDSLEIFFDVNNWTRHKIDITDVIQKRKYSIKTFSNSFKRLTKCCCAGFQLKKVVLQKDTGRFALGDTIYLEIITRSVLSPFKKKHSVKFVIEEEKYLCVSINKMLPFYHSFYYCLLKKRQLRCI